MARRSRDNINEHGSASRIIIMSDAFRYTYNTCMSGGSVAVLNVFVEFHVCGIAYINYAMNKMFLEIKIRQQPFKFICVHACGMGRAQQHLNFM